MNKKEVAEIKKQFKEDNPRFTIEKIANAYVISRNGERTVKYSKLQRFALLPENEIELYLKNFKKALGGRLGKGLVEYEFPKEAFEEDSPQGKLYTLLTSEMEEDEVNSYISYLVEKLEYPFDFYISIAFCNYSVPKKKEDAMESEDDEADDEVFDFIMVSFNESALTDIGLYYNTADEVVEKKMNTDIQILKAPCDGFMFPAFNDRSSDINSVLVYTKTPKTPNEVLVQEVLGCDFVMSSEQQTALFTTVLEDSLDEALNCDVVKAFQKNVAEVMYSSASDTVRPKLNKSEIKKLLENSGVDSEKLERFEENFEKEMGDIEVDPVNLIEIAKLDVKAPDVSVSVKKDAIDGIRIKESGGRKQLIIDLDSDVEINGFHI